LDKRELTYLKADVNDSEQLTEIAVSSKKYWGYSKLLMKIWKNDLTITINYIKENIVYKIYQDDLLIGFYALKFNEQYNCYEIDHLWLTPENINKGFGRLIFNNIINQLLKRKQSKAIAIAEPNAAGFYSKMNGKVIGQFKSKPKGRLLSIYEFNLKKDGHNNNT
jgi:hypothetical protein